MPPFFSLAIRNKEAMFTTFFLFGFAEEDFISFVRTLNFCYNPGKEEK